MDDVPVIDDVPALAAGLRTAATQDDQRRRTKKAFEPVVVEAHPQPMTDQAGRHRIEHLFQREAAA
jgi:hypothetical protein